MRPVLPLARSLGGTRGASCMRYGEENTSSNQVGAGKKEDQENPTRPGIRIGRITPLNPMYEQRQRNINEASVTTVRAIAKALHCNIEDLLEPVFEYKETSAA